ncbi:hypothetical protein NKG94_45760 [Micromonospora sp. M12]
MQSVALRDWLLDRLEAPELWAGQATPLSVAQLADRIGSDQDFRAVLDLWVGHDNYDLTRTLGLLIADEHVPYLPSQRYKPSGLRKRAQWERTWALQRREDAGRRSRLRCRRSTPRRTSSGRRTGGRAASSMCRRSGSSRTRRRGGTATAANCSVGPGGTT